MVTAVHKPHPSAAEALIADYGHEWEIWRELLPSGKHGDWIARRLSITPDVEGEVLRAPTVQGLAELLRSGQ